MALKPFSGTTQKEKDALETRFGITQDSRPDNEQLKIQHIIREFTVALAQQIDVHIEDSREKSLALTKLEESLMWAGKAIFKAPETF